MNDPCMPLASIVFEGDLRLQILQLLSVDRLYDYSTAHEYTIVINSGPSDPVRRGIQDVIESKISDGLRRKISIIDFSDLLPDSTPGGYYDQQALKLALANYYIQRYDAAYYLMLDAKNHFVKPSNVEDFFNQGRPLSSRIETSNYWRNYVSNSMKALQIDAQSGRNMLPSITPYVLYTDQVVELNNYLTNRYQSDLLTAVGETGGTEFLLYYAQLLKSGAISRYDLGGVPARTLFTSWPQDAETVVNIIHSFFSESVCIFGLHRNRLPQLTDEQIELIDNLWHQHLLNADEDTDWFLSRGAAKGRPLGVLATSTSSESQLLDSHLGRRRGAVVPPSANVASSSSLIADEGKRIKLEKGVTIGENCSVEGSVAIGDGSIIGNRVQVSGNVIIARGVTIDDDAVIDGQVGLGDRVYVGAGVRLSGVVDVYTDCVIESGAHLYGRRLAIGAPQRRGGEHRDAYVSIGRGSTLGQDVRVSGVCKIGAGVVIQAGSSVTGSIDADTEIQCCNDDGPTARTLLTTSTSSVSRRHAGSYGHQAPQFEIGDVSSVTTQMGFSRYSMRLPDESVLEFLLNNNGSEELVVSLHGATDRDNYTIPRFEWFNTLSEQPYSSIFIGDPALNFHPKIQLGWYLGTRNFNLHEYLATFVSEIALKIGARKVVFTGLSGGGFAALQIASFSPGSTAIVFNPRTEIPVVQDDHVVSWPFYFFLSNVMPEIAPSRASSESFAREWTDELGDRISARERFRQYTDCRVVFISNINDPFHSKETIPFEESAHADNVIQFVRYEGGFAHYEPGREMFLEALDGTFKQNF